jgi:hypothetical protein
MDYCDAIREVVDRAAKIRLPGERWNIVVRARRQFAKQDSCDSTLINPIEQIIEECIGEWSVAQKREIWESTETGANSEDGFEEHLLDCIDMDLASELLYYVIKELSSAANKKSGQRR